MNYLHINSLFSLLKLQKWTVIMYMSVMKMNRMQVWHKYEWFTLNNWYTVAVYRLHHTLHKTCKYNKKGRNPTTTDFLKIFLTRNVEFFKILTFLAKLFHYAIKSGCFLNAILTSETMFQTYDSLTLKHKMIITQSK